MPESTGMNQSQLSRSGGPVGRRALLRGATLAAPAMALLPPATATAATATPPRFNPHDWRSVRNQFLLTRQHAHFAAFMLASHPASVRTAITAVRNQLDTYPERYQMGLADIELGARARAALADYIGAAPAEIALTDSTTMGIGLVYAGLRLRPGDEVVTTTHEFYSTYEALRLRRESDGVVVREVAPYDDPAAARAEVMVARLLGAVTPRTRVLAMTWVHSSTGVKLPVRRIAEAIAELNSRRNVEERILVCLDAVHGFAVEDIDVPALGVDFFMTATHKWLFGPRGTGFVWGRPEAWARLRTTIPSFSIPAFVGWLTGQPPLGAPGDLHSPGGYHSFEQRWALPEAVAFHRAVGRDRIAAYTHAQARQLKEGLAQLSHVRLVTPRSPELSSGIVCCAIDGLSAEEVVTRLRDRHRILAGATPYRQSYVRFGPSLVTSPQEVTRVVRAVAALR
ncbi:aminotransferase class V-fold PLP-dependent enzyme [Micromonospora sp. NPDC000442]|uniref:aminotransferase class V-fold PLP-dependent enzyme n=1 Tax=Micromonospora sp. NPDC000442 TaxID=3364217 RepID=UPI0036879227